MHTLDPLWVIIVCTKQSHSWHGSGGNGRSRLSDSRFLWNPIVRRRVFDWGWMWSIQRERPVTSNDALQAVEGKMSHFLLEHFSFSRKFFLLEFRNNKSRQVGYNYHICEFVTLYILRPLNTECPFFKHLWSKNWLPTADCGAGAAILSRWWDNSDHYWLWDNDHHWQ